MKKYEVLIETVVVLIVVIVLIIFKAIPEMKKELGSSDHIISKTKIDRLIDINIDNNLFGYELSKDNKVVNVIFYNETSLTLYNKNIENKELSKAINSSYEILKERNKLTDVKIIVTKYDNDKNSYKKYFNNIKYSTYQENKSTYNELKTKYNMTSSTTEELLSNINIKSKDYVVAIKNENVVDYTDYVYKKLLVYQSQNNIENESVKSKNFNIQSIKINELSNYPTNNSYYYIKNNKVYAYIEVTVNNIDIGYCYKGSLNNYTKGKC